MINWMVHSATEEILEKLEAAHRMTATRGTYCAITGDSPFGVGGTGELRFDAGAPSFGLAIDAPDLLTGKSDPFSTTCSARESASRAARDQHRPMGRPMRRVDGHR